MMYSKVIHWADAWVTVIGNQAQMIESPFVHTDRRISFNEKEALEIAKECEFLGVVEMERARKVIELNCALEEKPKKETVEKFIQTTLI
jgi:hypothetical protein